MMDVRIACPCPGTPHDGDTVSLRDKMDLRTGTALQSLIVESIRSAENRLDQADIVGILNEGYLLYGIERWTLIDGRGRPLEVTKDNIRAVLLSDFALSAPIAEAADDLYPAAAIDPLVRRASMSSPATPTNGSTSAPPTTLQRRPSKRSSTSTSPTDATETTGSSPSGDSSSSPSLALVGA